MPFTTAQAEKAIWLIGRAMQNHTLELALENPRKVVGSLVGGSWLRYFVGASWPRTHDTKSLHAAPESVGMQAQEFGGSSRAFDHTFCFS